jgi:ABC-type transporter Mla MlaB component
MVMRKDTIERKEWNTSVKKSNIKTENYYQANLGTANKTTGNFKSIHLAGEHFIIKEEYPVKFYQPQASIEADLPGVYCKGIQYYDLKNIYFINSTGIANLIDLLKSLLEKNVEILFVNVSDKIKEKIKIMGLDHLLVCS